MQPVIQIVSPKAVRIVGRHFAPAPCDAFLDFDPILPGWPEERANEGDKPDLHFASAVTPPDRSSTPQSAPHKTAH